MPPQNRTKHITLNLRAMAAEDAPAVATLFYAAHADGGAGGWRAWDITRVLHENGVGVVAYAPDAPEPVGAVLAMRAGDDMDIINIAVAESYRRKRLGQGLLELLVTTANAAAVGRILLEVAEDNAPAKAFYANMGFNEIGTRPAYYPRGGYRVDAKIMALAKDNDV